MSVRCDLRPQEQITYRMDFAGRPGRSRASTRVRCASPAEQI